MPRKASIQIRRDTRNNWLAKNAVLKNGELGYETDTGILKVGDGTSGWNTIVRFANQNDVSMLNERIDNVLTVSSNNIYGVKIDTTNSNPETSVTYTDDAAGFVPMRGNDGNFDWGSWELPFKSLGIRPCVFKDGAVNYYLDPNDFTKKIDGSNADITSGLDGDVMIEIPKIYWKFSKNGTDRIIQISRVKREGFVCLAHTRGVNVVDNIYIGAYPGAVISNKLRSLSGKTPTGAKTHAAFRTDAQANGEGYEQFLFYQMQLLQILYVIFFKNLDGQTALGRGNVDASVLKKTGARNTSGMFYGSTDGTMQIKFCGIEDFWGNIRNWVDGLWSTANTVPARKLWIATDEFNTVPYQQGSEMRLDADPKPDNYIEYGTGFAVDVNGYIKDIHGTNETGFVVVNSTGSETTYYCDHASIKAGCVGCSGGNNISGAIAGFCHLNLGFAALQAHETVGGRLTWIKKQ
jgi:hypothetical protein